MNQPIPAVLAKALVLSAIACGLAAAAPVVDVQPLELDLGEVIEGQAVEGTVRVHNRGDTVLSIERVRPSCAACLRVSADAESVEPGDYTKVKITYLSEDQGGEDTRSVYVHTDDAGQPVVEVKLTVKVDDSPRPEVQLSTEQLGLGIVLWDGSAQVALSIRNAGEEPLTVTGIQCAGPLEVLGTLDEPLAAGASADVLVRTTGQLPEGRFQGAVVVATDDPVRGVVACQVTGFAASRQTLARIAEAAMVTVVREPDGTRRLEVLNGTRGNLIVASDGASGEATVRPGRMVPLAAGSDAVPAVLLAFPQQAGASPQP